MSHLIRGIATAAAVAIVATSGWTSSSRADDTVTGPGSWMGVKVITLNEGWREQYSFSGAGVRVTEVQSQSPADRIGIVEGDILVAIGSTSLRYEEDLATAHSRVDLTQPVPVVIARHNGSMMKIRNLDPIPVPEVETPAEAAAAASEVAVAVQTEAAPAEVPAAEPAAATAATPGTAGEATAAVEAPAAAVAAAAVAMMAPAATKPAAEVAHDEDPLETFGVQCTNLNRDLATALGFSSEGGVLVLQVSSGGSADRVGIRSGDVISAAGSQVVASVEVLAKALRSAISGITLHTWRRGDERDITVSLAPPPAPPTATAAAGSDEAVREELQSLRQELEALRAQMATSAKSDH